MRYPLFEVEWRGDLYSPHKPWQKTWELEVSCSSDFFGEADTIWMGEVGVGEWEP